MDNNELPCVRACPHAKPCCVHSLHGSRANRACGTRQRSVNYARTFQRENDAPTHICEREKGRERERAIEIEISV
jgi:hypothetical protein